MRSRPCVRRAQCRARYSTGGIHSCAQRRDRDASRSACHAPVAPSPPAVLTYCTTSPAPLRLPVPPRRCAVLLAAVRSTIICLFRLRALSVSLGSPHSGPLASLTILPLSSLERESHGLIPHGARILARGAQNISSSKSSRGKLTSGVPSRLSRLPVSMPITEPVDGVAVRAAKPRESAPGRR